MSDNKKPQYYDENGNPIDVPFIVQQAPQQSNMAEGARNIAKKSGGFVKEQFTGQEGSIFWLFQQFYKGIKLAIESVNQAISESAAKRQAREQQAEEEHLENTQNRQQRNQ